MKVAVASDQNQVAGHFGHCEQFHIFNVENGKVILEDSVKNPGHRPGFLPNYLNDLGIHVIISGGMGGGAIDIFNEKGIEVIVGIRGEAEAAVVEFANGNLKSTGSVCHEHQHAHECGGH